MPSSPLTYHSDKQTHRSIFTTLSAMRIFILSSLVVDYQRHETTVFLSFIILSQKSNFAPRGRIALSGSSRFTLTSTNSEKTILPREEDFSKTADQIMEAAPLYGEFSQIYNLGFISRVCNFNSDMQYYFA